MPANSLIAAYSELASAWQAVMNAGGPARCNGEWAHWAGIRNRIAQLEEMVAYQAASERRNKRGGGDESERNL